MKSLKEMKLCGEIHHIPPRGREFKYFILKREKQEHILATYVHILAIYHMKKILFYVMKVFNNLKILHAQKVYRGIFLIFIYVVNTPSSAAP
jgi:hypothetical protein